MLSPFLSSDIDSSVRGAGSGARRFLSLPLAVGGSPALRVLLSRPGATRSWTGVLPKKQTTRGGADSTLFSLLLVRLKRKDRGGKDILDKIGSSTATIFGICFLVCVSVVFFDLF